MKSNRRRRFTIRNKLISLIIINTFKYYEYSPFNVKKMWNKEFYIIVITFRWCQSCPVVSPWCNSRAISIRKRVARCSPSSPALRKGRDNPVSWRKLMNFWISPSLPWTGPAAAARSAARWESISSRSSRCTTPTRRGTCTGAWDAPLLPGNRPSSLLIIW